MPRDLEILALRALHREPAGRLPSAGELAAELERWLAGEPIRSRPVPWWEALRAWARRRPAVAGLGAALLVVGVAALLVTDYQRRAARNLARTLRQQLSAAETARAVDGFRNRRNHRGLASLAGVLRQDPGNLAPGRHVVGRLRDYAWPRPLRALATAGQEVRIAAVSPDGAVLATALSDGSVRLWSVADGSPLPPVWPTPAANWRRLAFSPDGRWLLSLAEPGRLHLWPVSGGEPALVAGSGDQPVHDALFLPSGEVLAVARAGQPVQLFLPGQPGAAFTLPEESRDGRVLEHDPSTGLLAVAGAEPAVRLWHGERREWSCILALPAPAAGLSFGDAGRLLAVTTTGRELVLYRLSDVAQLARHVHRAPEPARFSPAGLLLFFAAESAGLSVLRPPAFRPRELPERPGLPYWGLVFSRDGGRVLLESGQRGAQPYLLPPAGGLLLEGEAIPHDWEIQTALFLPDPRQVLLAGGTNPAVLWETGGLHPDGRVRGLGEGIVAAGFTADGTGLRLLLADGRLRVLEQPFDRLPEPVALAETAVDVAAFSPGASLVAVAQGSRVEVWQAAPPRRLARLAEASAAVSTLAFSPDGRTLAVGAEDASLVLWAVAEARPRGPALDLRRPARDEEFGASLISLEFSADSTRLAVAGQSYLAHVVDVAAGRAVMRADHRAPVSRALLLPGGDLLATASFSGDAQLWEVATGRPVGRPLPHAGALYDLDVSPDGRWLATAGDDRVARVWDARRGVLVSEFSAGYPVVRARFLAGGQALVSTTLQRHASVHEAATGLFLTRRRELGFAANRVVLSPDGRWAALYARRGKGGLLGVDLPDTPAPPWVADLAEALAGERLRPDGSLERVPPTEFLRLRGELRSLRGEDFWHARLLPGLLDP